MERSIAARKLHEADTVADVLRRARPLAVDERRVTPTARRSVEAGGGLCPNTRRAYARALRPARRLVRRPASSTTRLWRPTSLRCTTPGAPPRARRWRSPQRASARKPACFRAKVAGQPAFAGERTARARRVSADGKRIVVGTLTRRVRPRWPRGRWGSTHEHRLALLAVVRSRGRYRRGA